MNMNGESPNLKRTKTTYPSSSAVYSIDIVCPTLFSSFKKTLILVHYVTSYESRIVYLMYQEGPKQAISTYKKVIYRHHLRKVDGAT